MADEMMELLEGDVLDVDSDVENHDGFDDFDPDDEVPAAVRASMAAREAKKAALPVASLSSRLTSVDASSSQPSEVLERPASLPPTFDLPPGLLPPGLPSPTLLPPGLSPPGLLPPGLPQPAFQAPPGLPPPGLPCRISQDSGISGDRSPTGSEEAADKESTDSDSIEYEDAADSPVQTRRNGSNTQSESSADHFGDSAEHSGAEESTDATVVDGSKDYESATPFDEDTVIVDGRNDYLSATPFLDNSVHVWAALDVALVYSAEEMRALNDESAKLNFANYPYIDDDLLELLNRDKSKTKFQRFVDETPEATRARRAIHAALHPPKQKKEKTKNKWQKNQTNRENLQELYSSDKQLAYEQRAKQDEWSTAEIEDGERAQHYSGIQFPSERVAEIEGEEVNEEKEEKRGPWNEDGVCVGSEVESHEGGSEWAAEKREEVEDGRFDDRREENAFDYDSKRGSEVEKRGSFDESRGGRFDQFEEPARNYSGSNSVTSNRHAQERRVFRDERSGSQSSQVSQMTRPSRQRREEDRRVEQRDGEQTYRGDYQDPPMDAFGNPTESVAERSSTHSSAPRSAFSSSRKTSDPRDREEPRFNYSDRGNSRNGIDESYERDTRNRREEPRKDMREEDRYSSNGRSYQGGSRHSQSGDRWEQQSASGSAHAPRRSNNWKHETSWNSEETEKYGSADDRSFDGRSPSKSNYQREPVRVTQSSSQNSVDRMRDTDTRSKAKKVEPTYERYGPPIGSGTPDDWKTEKQSNSRDERNRYEDDRQLRENERAYQHSNASVRSNRGELDLRGDYDSGDRNRYSRAGYENREEERYSGNHREPARSSQRAQYEPEFDSRTSRDRESRDAFGNRIKGDEEPTIQYSRHGSEADYRGSRDNRHREDVGDRYSRDKYDDSSRMSQSYSNADHGESREHRDEYSRGSREHESSRMSQSSKAGRSDYERRDHDYPEDYSRHSRDSRDRRDERESTRMSQPSRSYAGSNVDKREMRDSRGSRDNRDEYDRRSQTSKARSSVDDRDSRDERKYRDSRDEYESRNYDRMSQASRSYAGSNADHREPRYPKESRDHYETREQNPRSETRHSDRARPDSREYREDRSREHDTRSQASRSHAGSIRDLRESREHFGDRYSREEREAYDERPRSSQHSRASVRQEEIRRDSRVSNGSRNSRGETREQEMERLAAEERQRLERERTLRKKRDEDRLIARMSNRRDEPYQPDYVEKYGVEKPNLSPLRQPSETTQWVAGYTEYMAHWYDPVTDIAHAITDEDVKKGYREGKFDVRTLFAMKCGAWKSFQPQEAWLTNKHWKETPFHGVLDAMRRQHEIELDEFHFGEWTDDVLHILKRHDKETSKR